MSDNGIIEGYPRFNRKSILGNHNMSFNMTQFNKKFESLKQKNPISHARKSLKSYKDGRNDGRAILRISSI